MYRVVKLVVERSKTLPPPRTRTGPPPFFGNGGGCFHSSKNTKKDVALRAGTVILWGMKLTLNNKTVADFEVEISGDCGDDSGVLWAEWENGVKLTYRELAEFEALYLARLVWGDLMDRR